MKGFPKRTLRLAKLEAGKEAEQWLELRRRLTIKTGSLHEGLTLVQRDRNAAWFARPGGVRLLICSEIGGEGRNSRFARHLVLFDLPLNPELLAQRIGRLDHIGQTADIQNRATALRQSALKEMNRLLGREVQRLQTLQKVNDHVRPQEIKLAQAQQEELATTLQQSSPVTG
jgi:superfamily II DNA/RNA helicase